MKAINFVTNLYDWLAKNLGPLATSAALIIKSIDNSV